MLTSVHVRLRHHVQVGTFNQLQITGHAVKTIAGYLSSLVPLFRQADSQGVVVSK